VTRGRWLTENSIPSGKKDNLIRVPDGEAWRAQLLGALLLLTESENWEQYGTLTPEQMSSVWVEVLYEFVEKGANVLPIGALVGYGGSDIPPGFLRCEGQAVSRTTYARLFAVFGTQYGAGDGSTTFNLPNTKKRQLTGVDSGQPVEYALGVKFGDVGHILKTGMLPAHTHVQKDAVNAGGGNVATGAPSGLVNGQVGTTVTGSTGNGDLVPHLDPYIAVYWLVYVGG